MNIKDRIVDFRRVPANQIAPSPHNWRVHPKSQREAFRGVIEQTRVRKAKTRKELRHDIDRLQRLVLALSYKLAACAEALTRKAENGRNGAPQSEH